MPHHKSPKKKIRSDAKKNVRNKSYLAGMRTAIKKVMVAIDTKTINDETVQLAKNAQAILAKAASKGMIPRARASRKTARIMAALKKAKGV